jgi:nucleotide-binding universal stress UspA family protein
MRPARVIVGIDNSPASRPALRWATVEAARRGADLHIMHAYHADWPDAAYSPPEKAAEIAGLGILTDAVRDVEFTAPNVTVTSHAVRGSAAGALIAAAEPGDLVVVGSRGRSELAAALTGSTGQQVAFHAPTSVAIVRGETGADDRPVVVGYDGSASARAVLEAAFEWAATHGSGLNIVRAFRPDMPAWPLDAEPPAAINAQTLQAALTDDLKHQAQPLTEKYPNVAVEYSVTAGDAAQALVAASREARLVVVGSRGHGGFVGLLLGSVGLRLLHHAHIPVLISRR